MSKIRFKPRVHEFGFQVYIWKGAKFSIFESTIFFENSMMTAIGTWSKSSGPFPWGQTSTSETSLKYSSHFPSLKCPQLIALTLSYLSIKFSKAQEILLDHSIPPVIFPSLESSIHFQLITSILGTIDETHLNTVSEIIPALRASVSRKTTTSLKQAQSFFSFVFL